MPFRKISRTVFGWAMYDFANSAYTTSILTVIFSVYFVNSVVPTEGVPFLGTTLKGVSLWGFLNSSVMAVTILMSPALGAWADATASKGRSLAFWAIVGSLCTMGFFFAKPGLVWSMAGLAFLATAAYEMSLVFYNAFLNDVSTKENAGFVSGFGFGLGYIGGGICLALNMFMIARPGLFGIPDSDPTLPYRVGFLTVGVWWLLFSLPTFLWVKDEPLVFTAPPTSRFKFAFHAFRQLKKTLLEIVHMEDTFKFLLAYIIYNDGIQTILLMAAIFGSQALGMSTVQLGFCYLMIQFVAFVGALVCGPLADSWGHKKVIFVTLAIYAAVTIWGTFMTTQTEFWILGFIIGLILGGSQAASRSLFSLLIPESRSGEMFSLFSIVGKASSLIGPFLFATVNQLWGLRPAVGSLLVFFVVGGILLLRVKEPRSHGFPA